MSKLIAATAAALLASPALAQEEPPRIEAQTPATFPLLEANQGVGVDEAHIYAVDNQAIVKIDKETGEEVARWEGPEEGPILHLDSAVIVDGLLYAAHSNYPDWPMTSSIEVWDAETLEHVDSHSFGIDRGSLTWIDRHDGAWWATFANYNRLFDRSSTSYGNKWNTQMVRLDDEFRIQEAWTFPAPIVDLFEDMSNSGGSWGPDGRLYIAGHDLPEIYAMELPEMGSELVWVGTVGVSNTGQGFAWDRSAAEPTVVAMIRGETDEENAVTVNLVDLDAAPWNAGTEAAAGADAAAPAEAAATQDASTAAATAP